MSPRIAALLATWFGAGRARFVPGTVGTLAGLPFVFTVHYYFGALAVLAFSLAVFAVGCVACRVYLASTGKEDPGEVVIDEVAGVALLAAALFPTWQAYVAAFVAFRVFDMVKPWPVSWADKRIKGAFGVMFDDMVAAAMPIVLWLAVGELFQPVWMAEAWRWLAGL